MYFEIKNIWCLIWNITEYTGCTFGIPLGWLFGKVIYHKGQKVNKISNEDEYICDYCHENGDDCQCLK